MVDFRINPEDFAEPTPGTPYKEGEEPRSLGEVAASIADSLARIATAQEAMARLAEIDIHATINAAVDEQVAEAVNEKLKETTKRGFIGRKPD